MVWLAWLGCAVPALLPTHDAMALIEAPVAAETGPGWEGRKILLVFEGDASVAPVGGMFDDHHAYITPVQQTYVLPEPGYVLFESLAEVLGQRGAEVWRSYGPPPGALPDGPTVVTMRVEQLEMHYWRTSGREVADGDYHLVRAKVRWRVADATWDEVVLTRVPASRDVFDAAAGQLATALQPRLP